MRQLQTATRQISESELESGKVAQEMVSKLANFVNESNKAAGLGGSGLDVQPLTEEEASDQEKVYSKLDEIDAKLNALKDSSETDGVVVKSWFEGG